MNYKVVFTVYLLVLIFTVSCNQNTDDFKIQFGFKKFDKKFGTCDSSGGGCASIILEYPEIKRAYNSSVRDSITNHIHGSLLGNYFNTSKAKSLDEMAQAFFNDYEGTIKDFPDNVLPWDLNNIISVIYNDNSIVSLQSEFYQFTGGAHGMSGIYFANLNSQTGAKLMLSDILNSKYEEQLNNIAEKIFRKEKELKPNENLEDVGFWFKDNKFSLNENFGIKNEAIMFYFNAYEIAPYAMGPTEIKIPYAEIKNLIKEDGLLFKVSSNTD